MKKFIQITVIITILLNISIIITTKATHLMGADLTWQCIGQDSFFVTLTKYRDCNGISLSPATINFRCTTSGQFITSVTMSNPTSIDITPGTAGNLSYCSNNDNIQKDNRCTNPYSSFPLGIEKYVYSKLVILNSTVCCKITISHYDYSRNSTINTIENPGAAGLYVEAKLNKCLNPCDNSPFFTNPPIAIICVGQPFIFNQGVQDVDRIGSGSLLDSLVYEFTSPMQSATSVVNYLNQYSYDKPINFKGFPNSNLTFIPNGLGLHLDKQTGDLMFTPMSTQNTVMAIKVKEYRNGALIGEVRRDMQIIVINCANNSPPTIIPPYFKEVCAGDIVTFSIQTSDTDIDDTLQISWNNGISQATWSDNNCLAKHPIANFSWQTTENDASSYPYTFTVTIKDDATPVQSSQTRSFKILVHPIPEAQIIKQSSACGQYYFSALTTEGVYTSFAWEIDNNNFIGPGPHNYQFRPGTHPYFMTITENNTSLHCNRTYFDTVSIDTFLTCDLGNDTDVCINTLITLTANYQNNTGTPNFRWSTSTSDTLATISLLVNKDTIISLTISDSLGCSFMDQININAHDNPIVDLGPDIRICSQINDTIDAIYTLDETGINTIRWMESISGIEIGYGEQLTVSDSGKYICVVSDNLNCSGRDTIKVAVNPQINAYAEDKTICRFDTAILVANQTGSGMENYIWLRGSDSISESRIVHVRPTDNTYYQLIVEETFLNKTCSDSEKVLVTVNSLPKINISPLTKHCPFDPVIHLNNYVISPSLPWKGHWYTESNGLEHSDLFNPFLAGSGIHTLYYEYTDNSTMCSNVDTNYIEIKELPEVHVGNDTTICSHNGLFKLVSSPANGSWRGSLKLIKCGDDWCFDPKGEEIVDNGQYQFIYTIKGNNYCENSDTVLITVNFTPEPEAGTYDDLCINSSPITLVTNPIGGTWYGEGIIGDKFYPTATKEGIFELVYKVNNKTCFASDTTYVIVHLLPVVDAGSYKTYCRNEGLVKLSGSPINGTWSEHVGIQGDYFNTNIGKDEETDYEIEYSYIDENGCENKDTAIITIKPEPEILIDPIDKFCYNDSNIIKARFKNADGMIWLKDEDYSDGHFIGDLTNPEIIYLPGNKDLDRLYFLIKARTINIDGVCEPSTYTLKVNIDALPILEFEALPNNGCTPLFVKFLNYSHIDKGEIKEYIWNFGDGSESSQKNPGHIYNNHGNFDVSLSIISDKNCYNQILKTKLITANIVPKAEFTTNQPNILISAPTVHFINITRNESSGTEYQWNFGDYLEKHQGISFDRDPSYRFSDTGSYTVKLIARNEFGCIDSFMLEIKINRDLTVYIPNAFTPGSQSPEVNDIFKVIAKDLRSFDLNIYNRTGELVYTSHNYESHGWDGTLSSDNTLAPADAYIYIVKITSDEGKEYNFKGTVTLLR